MLPAARSGWRVPAHEQELVELVSMVPKIMQHEVLQGLGPRASVRPSHRAA